MARDPDAHPDIYTVARGQLGTAQAARDILALLHERQRPMSYSLIKSRCSSRYTAAEIAASLIDLIEQAKVRPTDDELYELETHD